jgi:MFS family permease
MPTAEEPPHGWRRWVAFAAIMVPYLCYAYLWNTENYLRPYIAAAMGLDHQAVSALYTLQGLGALCGALLIAPWADRYGRRNTLAATIVGFGIAALLTVLVQSYAALLLQRWVMGFFLGGVFGCTVSLYVGLFRPEECGLLAGLVQLVYNGGDATLSWFGRLAAESDWRQVVMSGGAAALIAAVLLLLLVPDDREKAETTGTAPIARDSASVRELFLEGRTSLTLRLALLCGLNFFAFQSFNGWLSTYLREVQQLSANVVGGMVTTVHLGSMTGAILWGLAADRYGRRFNAYAFYAAGVLILLYLAIPAASPVMAVVGFAYGFSFVASGVWGPYFTELYPPHLRATAASIFNWGRAVSLIGALASGWLAEHLGLRAAMMVGAVVFICAAALWRTLPETLARRTQSSAETP